MSSPSLKRRARRPVTGEQLARMGDIGRSELVRGKLVLASPTFPDHGRVEFRFATELHAFVEPRELGLVLVGEVGIYTGRNPDTVRGADVLFISHARHAKCSKGSGYLDGAPELIVEVLSGSDRPRKVMEKLREYFAIGVKLVWAADQVKRTVAAYRSPTEFETLREGDELTGGDVLPAFRVPVARMFR